MDRRLLTTTFLAVLISACGGEEGAGKKSPDRVERSSVVGSWITDPARLAEGMKALFKGVLTDERLPVAESQAFWVFRGDGTGRFWPPLLGDLKGKSQPWPEPPYEFSWTMDGVRILLEPRDGVGFDAESPHVLEFQPPDVLRDLRLKSPTLPEANEFVRQMSERLIRADPLQESPAYAAQRARRQEKSKRK